MTGAVVDVTSDPGRSPGRRASWRERLKTLTSPQFLRFIVVGGFNTLFGYGLFAALQATLGQVMNYLLVTVVSYVIAIFEAFLMQRYVVFRVRSRFFGDLWRFSGVYLVVLAANLLVLPLLHDVLGVPLLIAQAIFTFVSAIATFTINRTFTFRRPSAEPTEVAE